MAKYADLLGKAVGEIAASFKKRSAAKLSSARNAVLIAKNKQVSCMSDFELVTWLVIKQGEES